MNPVPKAGRLTEVTLPKRSPLALDSPTKRKSRSRTTISTRDLILKEAARLFFEHGFSEVSIDIICRKVRLSKGAFYYNFASKETLLYVFNELYLMRGIELLAQLQAEDRSVLSKFVDLFEHSANSLDNWQHFIAVANQEHRYLKGTLAKRVRAMRNEYQKGVESLITDGQRRGEIVTSLDPKLMVFNYFGTVNWIYRWYNKDGRMTPSEVMTATRIQFLHGIVEKGALL